MAIDNQSAAIPWLGTTTYPNDTIGKRLQDLAAEVSSATIPDGSVTTAKLASNAVTGPNISSGAVTSAKLGNNAVQFAKFQAVAAYKLIGNNTNASANIAEITSTAFILGTLLACADAAAVRTAIGLVLGTDVQAYDADLAAIAALTSAADKLPYATGAGTWALADLPAVGRALIATAQTKDLILSTASVTGATQTMDSTHWGRLVRFDRTTGITATLPANAPVDTQFDWLQTNTGQVTFAAGSGGTLVNRQGHTKSFDRWAGGSAIVNANSGGSAAQWVLLGDTTT
ncbi:MAG: hypothetical protein RJA36_850 [Pseudomonadota bacterium]|jgi:hypothetical protein